MEVTDFFKFDKFVAPILIKILYWIGIVLIVLSTLGGIVGLRYFESGMSAEYAAYTLGHALIILLSGALFLLLLRVVCELWLAIFKINDRVGMLVGQEKKEP
jgi:hypothetical protein